MFMQECRLNILVNGRREVRGKVGYYPSCSLPMRMGGAGAVKTDCFAALVISAETYSGMCFIRAEAAVQASSSHIGLWSCSLLRGLRRQRPKTARADSLHHFSASFSFSFSNTGDVCSQVFPHYGTKEQIETRLSLLLSVRKSWPQPQGF